MLKEHKNSDQNTNLNSLKQAFFKTSRAFRTSLPILLGVLMLLALANTLIPKQAYSLVFSKNVLMDPLIGAVVGSISAGNALTSYITPFLSSQGRGAG
jgi:hypothetical protein